MFDPESTSYALSIASSTVSLASKLEARLSTNANRKAANKLGYSIHTIGNARQLVDSLDLEGRDLDRAEALIDAYAVVAYEDMTKGIRKWR